MPLYTDMRLTTQPNSKSIDIIHFLLNKIEETMDQPDAGIWEFRNRRQLHCYTYLFHWAGSRAALKIGKAIGDQNLVQKAEQLRNLAASNIEKCYDPIRKAYTQAIDVDQLDASSLKLISMGYLDPDSQKAKDHLAALERELKSPEGYFFRYKHSDDFGVPESTFMICSFWYAEALACVGRVAEASLMVEKLIATGNHVGLLSEDIGTNGSQWGNFPQTYSHVGLMNAVFRIARKLDRPLYD